MRNEAGPVDVKDAIIAIQVSDLEKSKAWYVKALGKLPDLEPFPGNIEFKVGGAWVQINKGKPNPSGWDLQLEVADLNRERERLREAGVAATEISTVPGVIRYFDLKDPDGNSMRWFQVLTEDPRVTGNVKQ